MNAIVSRPSTTPQNPCQADCATSNGPTSTDCQERNVSIRSRWMCRARAASRSTASGDLALWFLSVSRKPELFFGTESRLPASARQVLPRAGPFDPRKSGGVRVGNGRYGNHAGGSAAAQRWGLPVTRAAMRISVSDPDRIPELPVVPPRAAGRRRRARRRRRRSPSRSSARVPWTRTRTSSSSACSRGAPPTATSASSCSSRRSPERAIRSASVTLSARAPAVAVGTRP